MRVLTVVIALFAFTCINAQSVGIGTETPNAPLHIKSAAATEVLRIEGNNPNISFYNNALGFRGYLRTHTAGIELGSPTGSGLPVIIAPGFTPIGYFTTSGRVGLGISNPVEHNSTPELDKYFLLVEPQFTYTDIHNLIFMIYQ
jgi:hypothetical protein